MGVSAIFYNTTNNLRSENETIYVSLISAAVMFSISGLLGAFCFVNKGLVKAETKLKEELEKKIIELIDSQSLAKHFFTMNEYCSILIRKK